MAKKENRTWLRSVVWYGAVIVGLLIASGGTAVAQSGEDTYQPPHDQPGPAMDRIQFRSFHVDIAPQEIQRDAMDIYFFNLKTEASRELRSDESIRLYEAPALSIALGLNPAPAPEGQLNPFSLVEVRRAMQHLVNREFIAQEIYKGLARPMFTHVSPFDYDYTILTAMLAQEDLAYDPERGRAQIAAAMEGAGAELVDEAWHFQGEPIRLKFIIRVEDERREVGDLIRAELEAAGFLVAPNYQQFAPAIFTWQGTDPQQFEWHLYTEGWGRGAADRYDSVTLNQMAAPWFGNMPGWQESGFWQYENAALDEIGQRIFRGDFADQTERDSLYREATKVALDDSARIWLATIVANFPSNAGIEGVTEDVSAGPKLQWTLREAYLPGQDTLTVGNLWVWTERSTWNPVSGFGDVYSSDIWRNLVDATVTRHPFTGVPMPFRTTYEVETAGPTSKLEVPSDAVRWDAQTESWAEVGGGVQATSKIVYDYSKFFQSNWHHGEPITMADVVYGIYQTFDMVYSSDKSQVEFAIATVNRPLLDTFRGFRILDDNRIEVYVNYWHFVDDYIAEYGVPSGISMPWEVLAAMDDIVFSQRRGAYSDTSALRFSVPWLSLVQDRDARTVDRTLRQFNSEDRFPDSVFQIGGRTLVNLDEAKTRYEAARTWFDETGLMVISNGPFMLTRFDPPAQFAEIEAFRDPTYPFKPGDWYFGEAPNLQIDAEAPGGIGLGDALDVDVRIEGPGELNVLYVLANPATGHVVKSGHGEATGDAGAFLVSLTEQETAALAPGLYQLSLTAFSDELSTVVERTLTIEAGGSSGSGGGTSSGGGGAQQPSGGCSIGGATADLGLLGIVLLGTVVTLGAKRRRR